MEKLNNKGFTLVELLAVVVILAVVMGIATTSVITAMNNSRKGSLEDSAKSVANAFKTKYSEALVLGGASDVYKDVVNGYAFNTASDEKPVFYSISTALKDELNLSPSAYMLNSTVVGKPASDNKVDTQGSFIAFDGEKVVACLIAVPGGNYYVANAASDSETIDDVLNIKVTLLDSAGKGVAATDSLFADNKVMWACSDGSASWK